jgi:hypothetical protein
MPMITLFIYIEPYSKEYIIHVNLTNEVEVILTLSNFSPVYDTPSQYRITLHNISDLNYYDLPASLQEYFSGPRPLDEHR